MKKVIDLAKERNIKDQFKYIVGGAPLSDKFAAEIGADAYCFDTVSAVERVKEFVKGN
jgi:methanogenic corrinoid protein MtbC1